MRVASAAIEMHSGHALLGVMHRGQELVCRDGNQRAGKQVRAICAPRALPQSGNSKHVAVGEAHEELIARAVLVDVRLVEAAHDEQAALSAAPRVAIARQAA